MPRPCTTFACHSRSSGFRRTPRSALTVVFVVVVEELVLVLVVLVLVLVLVLPLAVVVWSCGLVGELEKRPSHENRMCRRQFTVA